MRGAEPGEAVTAACHPGLRDSAAHSRYTTNTTVRLPAPVSPHFLTTNLAVMSHHTETGSRISSNYQPRLPVIQDLLVRLLRRARARSRPSALRRLTSPPSPPSPAVKVEKAR